LEDVVVFGSGYSIEVVASREQVIARKGGVLRDETADFGVDGNRGDAGEHRFAGLGQA
jgi:hypothetical protein